MIYRDLSANTSLDWCIAVLIYFAPAPSPVPRFSVPRGTPPTPPLIVLVLRVLKQDRCNRFFSSSPGSHVACCFDIGYLPTGFLLLGGGARILRSSVYAGNPVCRDRRGCGSTPLSWFLLLSVL